MLSRHYGTALPILSLGARKERVVNSTEQRPPVSWLLCLLGGGEGVPVGHIIKSYSYFIVTTHEYDTQACGFFKVNLLLSLIINSLFLQRCWTQDSPHSKIRLRTWCIDTRVPWIQKCCRL